MEVVNGCCAGLDVHQVTVVACARWTEQGQRRQEVATFGTMTRDLTRHRAQLVAEQTRVVNRIHQTLEDANLKLGVVASDILG